MSLDRCSTLSASIRCSDACSTRRTISPGQAEVIAISPTQHGDLTYANEADTERAYFEYVSGSMFDTFGLHPVLGRLLNAKDDITLGAHPYAVISYDYWTRRFARDRNVIGRTFRMSDDLYQIVGVVHLGLPAPSRAQLPVFSCLR